MTDLERKYRFYIKVDHDQEYHVFETRYYAQKYIDEVLSKEVTLVNAFYQIEKADDGFAIYIVRREVI